ncbi:LysM peptidoglycan-binding domain-containing protein [Nocardiopsis coralliicola]
MVDSAPPGPSGAAPVVPRQRGASEPSAGARPHRPESRPGHRRPAAPYDWAVDVPEWTPPPAVSGLPEFGAPPAVRMRLTLRGRAVLVALLCALATGAVSLLFAASASAGSASAAPVASFFSGSVSPTVVVQEGDSLWLIAERVAPAEDTRRTVHSIVELNSLAGTELEPGQILRVPRH